ncbi:MAG TPA: PAS domain-containing protein [Rhizomicrobium sp.]|nr:PAS domain-containing protein [Rhizomicrobium sp.]
MAVAYAGSLEPQRAPDRSSLYAASLDELDNPAVRTGASYWRMLKGARKIPARSELSPRDMRAILKHVLLLRVIDGGADYEYRIVGDVHVQAYGMQFQGSRLSTLEARAKGLGNMLRGLYEHVRVTAEPFAVRGWIGREVKDARFVYFESAFLPLGDDGLTVDHIACVSVYVPRAPD